MIRTEIHRDYLIGTDPVAPVGQGTISLDSVRIVDSLQQCFDGFHADLGARTNQWHPRIEDKQGLFYYHKHVTTMDRGSMPQWPKWIVSEDLVEVDLDYALAHEDFPVLDLLPGQKPVLQEGQRALIMRGVIDEVDMVGWAEVFWHLNRLRIKGLDPGWFTSEFRVPMDWIYRLKVAPLVWSMAQAKLRGWHV